jgi:hypothetical protein
MGSLVKPKLQSSPALPPMANPPVFANAYSQIAAGAAGKKPKKGEFGGTVKNEGGLAGAVAPAPLATPSLLG